MSEQNQDKSAQAAKIVRNHALAGGAAIFLLPIPLLDIGLLGGIHLRMLRELARLYDVEFSEQRANALIGTLAGVSATTVAGSLLSLVPGPGRLLLGLGALTLPAASTYALGRVFIKHFESGGTFLTFDASRAKKDYDEELEGARKEAEPSYVGVKP